MMWVRSLAFAAGLTIAGAGAGMSQTARFSTVMAVAGSQVRLGVHGVAGPDCRSGPLPTIQLLKFPERGSVSIVPAKMRTRQVTRCGEIELDVHAIMYKAAPNATGEDVVAYSVAESQTQTTTYTIRVKFVGKPGTPLVPVPARPSGRDGVNI